MKPLPDNARTRNISPPHARREHCPQCNDTGWVTLDEAPVVAGVEYEPGVAPCPYCERGKAIEFPDSEKQSPSSVTSPWGGEGFWRGRTDVGIVPHHSGSVPLSRDENRRRLAGLRAQLGFVGRDVPGDETPEAPTVGRASGRLVKERERLPDERWFGRNVARGIDA